MRMEDIARLAGVSKSAVSLALSGKPGIGQETRERILQIAKEHDYLPKLRSDQAGTPQKSITFLVFANSGIVLHEYYQQPFFRELIHFIEERCRSLGYSLIFSTVDLDKDDHEIAALVEEKRSQGVILLGTNLSRARVSSIAQRLLLPLVVLDNCYETLPYHFVGINNMMGAYQAGVHLCDLGHRHIGYIASDDRIHNFEERKRGFAFSLKERGIVLEEDCIFSVAPTILTSQEALKLQLDAYLSSGRAMPSAFFCECDYIAISALKTLAEMGFRVPEDVSVVGFDNITEARIVTPELTTVHVEKERLAIQAVDVLVRDIESDVPVRTKIAVDTQLIERQSARMFTKPHPE
ncbi:LacI family DNA-binding transcriptional regulator [Paenibacillus sp. S-38]|uniref:LacI family DNA-binding transcriptional regulator n=1 Tax=Paenibacillus sp. S-38 TaxID=3416710 RepID=UPI003CF7E23D